MSGNLKPFELYETGTQVYRRYTEGDTVTFKNSIWIAGSNIKLGKLPSEFNYEWTQSESGDITGIGITASAGLTGTKRTISGFHHQVITIATGGVTTAHIADNAITSSKIADGAILGVDVANGVTLTNPDATGDVEVFGDVYVTGTAATDLNFAQILNPIITINGDNRNIAIQLNSGGISADVPSKISTFHRLTIGSTLGGDGGHALVVNGGVRAEGGITSGGTVRGTTGDFNQLVATGISAAEITSTGLIKGNTGDFDNIVAHGGISANGLTLSHLATPFLG